MATPFGPFNRATCSIGGPWEIVAEEQGQIDGTTAWDVFAQHGGGVRVPAGANLHHRDQRAAEMGRLERVVDWPIAGEAVGGVL